jgi:tetratricopeptide (TPR) repeat protein
MISRDVASHYNPLSATVAEPDRGPRRPTWPGPALLFAAMGVLVSPAASWSSEIDQPHVIAAIEAAADRNEELMATETQAALKFCDTQSNTDACLLRTHMSLASALSTIGAYPPADQHLHASAALPSYREDPMVQVTIAGMLAPNLIMSGKTEEAAATIKRGREWARQLAKENPDAEKQVGFPVEYLLEGAQAMLYYMMDEPARAADAQKKWVVVAAQKGPAVQSRELAKLGEFQTAAGETEDAEKSFELALEAAKKSGDDAAVAEVNAVITHFQSQGAPADR